MMRLVLCEDPPLKGFGEEEGGWMGPEGEGRQVREDSSSVFLS